MYGEQAAFISAGGYHHHIGLNTWNSKGAPPASPYGVGLFHTAILYPTRKDLAEILDRLQIVHYPLTGASDHGVSEALYLDDPDGNGVELYWDKPREQWPKKPDGSLEMYTRPLNLESLLGELN
jgi:catechol 2,3-dioxygenase